MPRPSSITPSMLVEVARRRAEGEQWKQIAITFRERGWPADRATWWRAGLRDVAQRQDACEARPEAVTP